MATMSQVFRKNKTQENVNQALCIAKQKARKPAFVYRNVKHSGFFHPGMVTTGKKCLSTLLGKEWISSKEVQPRRQVLQISDLLMSNILQPFHLNHVILKLHMCIQRILHYYHVRLYQNISQTSSVQQSVTVSKLNAAISIRSENVCTCNK